MLNFKLIAIHTDPSSVSWAVSVADPKSLRAHREKCDRGGSEQARHAASGKSVKKVVRTLCRVEGRGAI